MKEIVIIHGWRAKVSKFIPLATEFDNMGWKVHLIELPGFDLDEPEFGWRIIDYAKFVEEKVQMVRSQNSHLILFGHSFGGMVATQIVANGSVEVDGLVLCATNGVVRSTSLKRLSFLLVAKLGKLVAKFFNLEQFLRRYLYKFLHEHDYEKTSGVMREVFKNAIEFDIKPLLKSINIPILVLWGSDDKMTPVSAVRIIECSSKNVKSKIYTGIKHNLPYVLPSEITTEVAEWYLEAVKGKERN